MFVSFVKLEISQNDNNWANIFDLKNILLGKVQPTGNITMLTSNLAAPFFYLYYLPVTTFFPEYFVFAAFPLKLGEK